MSLSILNNPASLASQNQLSETNASLQKTLLQLSSGSRINSGADDAAGLAIADGLRANISALTQSARNANDGVGQLQVADGALAQVTSLLNRAVTLATEASTGTITGNQRTALDQEYTAIKAEIDRIGGKTTYNGQTIFTGATTTTDYNTWNLGTGLNTGSSLTTGGTLTITDTKTGTQKSYTSAANTTVGALETAIQADIGTGAGKLDINVSVDASGELQIKDAGSDKSIYVTSTVIELTVANGTTTSGSNSNVFLSDGSSASVATTIGTTINKLTSSDLGLAASLNSDTNSQTALTQITTAIGTIASQRGAIGASINRLQSATNVINNQIQNLTSAEDGIRAADIPSTVASLTKYSILEQTGVAALSQANQMQQLVLSLLK
jgi:flagellin